MSKPCEVCGKDITGVYCEVAKRRYCSFACRDVATKKHWFTCATCGKHDWRPGALRRGGVNYCNKECHRQAQLGTAPPNKTPGIIKQCEICNQAFRVITARKDSARFCSHQCQHEAKRRVVGDAHPLHKAPITLRCQWCGTEFMAKPCFTNGAKRYCSRECTGAAKTAMQGGRRSKPELRLEEHLQRQEVPFKPQARVGRYSVDFAVPGTSLLVEVNGDYWHNKPDVAEKDRRKKAYLEAQGYRLAVVWEHELNADPAACAARIKLMAEAS